MTVKRKEMMITEVRTFYKVSPRDRPADYRSPKKPNKVRCVVDPQPHPRIAIKHEVPLPCPFCGNGVNDKGIYIGPCGNGGHLVQCNKCLASSGKSNLPDRWDADKRGNLDKFLVLKAIKAWNRRA